MHKLLDALAPAFNGHITGALHVNARVGHPGFLHVGGNDIHHRVGSGDGGSDRLFIADVSRHQDDAAGARTDRASIGPFWVTHRHPDHGPFLREAANDPAAQEACSPKHGDERRHERALMAAGDRPSG